MLGGERGQVNETKRVAHSSPILAEWSSSAWRNFGVTAGESPAATLLPDPIMRKSKFYWRQHEKKEVPDVKCPTQAKIGLEWATRLIAVPGWFQYRVSNFP